MMDKAKLLWSKTNRWHRGLLIFVILELRILPGGQVGFTCNDPTLSHPFSGDTISWKLLLVTTVFLPLAVMLLVEKLYHSNKATKSKEQAMCWYKEYLFGLLLNLIIVHILKTIVGSPRPHFFDTCSPKEASTCKGSEYVPSYTCTRAHWLSQSDRSFPSGHTSLGVHVGLFLAYYLYKRTTSPLSSKVIATQAVCIVAMILCGVSRIIDRRHHWWDVLAGATIAAPILCFTVQSLCENFECPICPNTSEDQIEDNSDEVLLNSKET